MILKNEINYWIHMLDEAFVLNESRSNIIDALEKEFGKDTLYNENRNYVVDEDTMNRAFSIFNKLIFGERLPKINVQCLNEQEIKKIFIETNQSQRDPNNYYAIYIPVPDWKRINSNSKCQIPPKHFLIMNTSDGPTVFAFALNSLCHEMIHYLDTIEGDVLYEVLVAYHSKQPFDEHSTKTFVDYMNKLNKNEVGMTIIPNGLGIDREKIESMSVMRMKRLLELESEIMNEDFLQMRKSNILDRVSVDENGELYAILF